jgi:hypothetical protein
MTPTLLLCGSQAIQWSEDYLSSLREMLLADSALQPLVHAIRDLPQLWATLLEADTALHKMPGKQTLDRFTRWLDGERLLEKDSPSDLNMIMSPLTVIMQLVEYISHLHQSNLTHLQILDGAKHGGIQGFCTGFLAAITLSISRDESDVAELGTVALRLATCIGAYVDLDQCNSSGFACLAVRWPTAADERKVKDILETYNGVSGDTRSWNNSLTMLAGIFICAVRCGIGDTHGSPSSQIQHNRRAEQYRRPRQGYPSVWPLP